MTIVNEVIVKPNDILYASPIAGGATSRILRMKELGIKKDGLFLPGDWERNPRKFKDLQCWNDYHLFLDGKVTVYPWQSLWDNMKIDGYIQANDKRHIEIAISRDGDLALTDGRHRLILAQEFNIPLIPVNVLDIHPDYKFGQLKLIKNKIIPEFLYDMIASKWDKTIEVYHNYGSIQQRYNLVKDYLPLFRGLNVLEIGSNAGGMMWSIIQYANCLIELEKQEKYYNQCKIMSNCLHSLHDGMVVMINESLRDFNSNNYEFNALYASFVLYHLNNDEIKILEDQILSRCKVVIIPNRNKERPSMINMYHLNRPEEIEHLLVKNGFKVTIDNGKEKRYSVIIGEKK